MSAEWIAGNVRARALLNRRLGAQRTRELAAHTSLAEALRALSDSPYRHDVHPDHGLAEAQQAIAASLLWNLRVLAGWQPRAGAEAVRVLAGWFELANLAEHARALAGYPAARPYQLGTLASTWSRLTAATSLSQLRTALADSRWGDPGGEAPTAIATGTQLAWAVRVAGGVPEAAAWARGGAAVLVARALLLGRLRLTGPAASRAAALLGPTATGAADLEDFTRRLPTDARWPLTGIGTADELWRAEARWWARVERDGFDLLRRPRFGPAPVIGTVAVLAADAHRCQAALEVAARGGGRLEVFDAVA